jgi:hypothetical protein
MLLHRVLKPPAFKAAIAPIVVDAGLLPHGRLKTRAVTAPRVEDHGCCE